VNPALESFNLDSVLEFFERHRISKFIPDCQQHDRLPSRARRPTNSKMTNTHAIDRYKPPNHPDKSDRKEVGRSIGIRATGIYQGETEPPHIDLRYDDDGKSNKSTKNNPIRDLKDILVTKLDIDSILLLCNTLKSLKTDVEITFYPNILRNLTSDVHIRVNGKPAHQVPQFRLGVVCGNGLTYNLYILLPAIFNKTTYEKHRRRREIVNGVKEHIIEAFMDKCLIPACFAIIPSTLQTGLDSDYSYAKAAAQAAAHERKLNQTGAGGRMLERSFTIPAAYLEKVWEKCGELLRNEMQAGNESLTAFKGYKLLVSGKQFKNKVFTESGNLKHLMKTFRERVPSYMDPLIKDIMQFR